MSIGRGNILLSKSRHTAVGFFLIFGYTQMQYKARLLLQVSVMNVGTLLSILICTVRVYVS